MEEGHEILAVLDKYFPKQFDGKDSIQWLHKHTTQKRQDEWAAFFFEEYCFSLLTRFLGGWKGPRITNSKRFDYQRNFVWDLKLEATKDRNGKTLSWIILNDIRSTRRVMGLESGIGYVIAMTEFTYDIDGKLRAWRDKFEGITKTRMNSRVLKKSGRIIELKAIFIRNTDQVQRAIDDGWIGIFNQGRNSDGSKRDPKFQINFQDVPKEFLIKL